ncbi:MAG: glycosyltransferase family 39 protein [Patescibacteria group bacterium]
MGRIRKYISENSRVIGWSVLGVLLVSWLMLYKLGNLTDGMSAAELSATSAAVGWHGIYQNVLYLPLNFIRSVIFALFTDHGLLLGRLPNALFGALTIITFACLIKVWHGTRTAVMATLLFATSAWVLHVSRLASFDVMYLWTLPTLLLLHALFNKHAKNPIVWFGSAIVWGCMLYIPGMIWLVLLSIYLLRSQIATGWRHFSRWWQRLGYLLLALAGLPLLVFNLAKFGGVTMWLGLPTELSGPLILLKQLAAVPVHMFVRGPRYPEVWLDSVPLLDIFSLAMCFVGIYFYATHIKASRTRLLGLFTVLGVLLVAIGGPVGLSLLVPVLYITIATGIAYMMHDWLHVFPNNPLARGIGIGLISLAIGLSCLYNLRAYFVAWPHNPTTQAVFQYRP